MKCLFHRKTDVMVVIRNPRNFFNLAFFCWSVLQLIQELLNHYCFTKTSDTGDHQLTVTLNDFLIDFVYFIYSANQPVNRCIRNICNKLRIGQQRLFFSQTHKVNI